MVSETRFGSAQLPEEQAAALRRAVKLEWITIVYTAVGPFILGRMKQRPAEPLHDRVLLADADMQKADWLTATGT